MLIEFELINDKLTISSNHSNQFDKTNKKFQLYILFQLI